MYDIDIYLQKAVYAPTVNSIEPKDANLDCI